MNYESVYVNIRTTAERGMVYTAIESMRDALYKKEQDFFHIIETETPVAISRSIKQAFSELSDTSPMAVQTYLDGLRAQLVMLRVLTLEIAFDPTEESLAVFIIWIRRHLGNDVIMEISVDKGLYGGARVSYEGRYKEINLAYLIENTMRQKQESINNILESVTI